MNYEYVTKRIERMLGMVVIGVLVFVIAFILIIRHNVREAQDEGNKLHYRTIRLHTPEGICNFIVSPTGLTKYIKPGTTYWQYTQEHKSKMGGN